MFSIFERLFRIEAGNWHTERGAVRRPRAQIRRQRSGTQYGADIVIRFKGAAIGSSSTCLAECKNYAANPSGLTVDTVGAKLLQAAANFGSEPVDHWILISPDLDPNNELDMMVEGWNATQFFPFTVQIWSPQTSIRELFAIDPDIYRNLYGEDPPALRRDEADVVAEFSERLRPPLRLPEQLRKFVQGSIDLRQFTARWGGAARRLWDASRFDPEDGDGDDDDASTRIGSRSLLRRVDPEDAERWLVDFFHRSMKEYFVAKAFHRAVNSPDPYAPARELLLTAPVQPEVAGFFRLLAGTEQKAATTVLTRLAHSARVGSSQGTLGGGAISLYHAAGGRLAGAGWKSLQLDGALLVGADLSNSDFRGSTLRRADLSSADLTGADLRFADLTGANLDAGGSIVGLAPDASAHRFVCLTQDCELGRITVQADGTLKFTAIPLRRTLPHPENVCILKEDIILVTAPSEFLIAEVSEESATEVAYFRVSSELRSAAIVDQAFLGLIIETEYAESEALLIDIGNGQVRWRVQVQPNADAYGWFAHGVVVSSGTQLLLFTEDGYVASMRGALEPTAAICVRDDHAILVSQYGQQTRLPLNNSGDPVSLTVHRGAGTAVTAADGRVLSSGTDGSIVLTERDEYGIPAVVARIERRLRCDGALVEALKSDREFAIFTANGAH